jgi:hypothetical protein
MGVLAGWMRPGFPHSNTAVYDSTAVSATQSLTTTKLTSPIASTGAIKGSFISNGLTAQYLGQFVNIGATREAYGYFLLPTAPGTTAPKLSGRVVLGAP